jgi:hypothetical protein
MGTTPSWRDPAAAIGPCPSRGRASTGTQQGLAALWFDKGTGK